MPTHICYQDTTKRAGVSTMVNFSSHRPSKMCSRFSQNLLHVVGIITDGASIANDNTQPGEMRHDIEIVKELVRHQTHKGGEIRRFGPYEHPGFLPRSSLDCGWWDWRRVFGAPWKDTTEHINALELRALQAAA